MRTLSPPQQPVSIQLTHEEADALWDAASGRVRPGDEGEQASPLARAVEQLWAATSTPELEELRRSIQAEFD